MDPLKYISPRRIFKVSRWLHKWLGLVGMVYLSLMALSGILTNHPGWISRISVPSSWIGQSDPYRNWNRSTLRNIIFSARNPHKGFAYGCAGIWQTNDSGKTFIPFMEGLPASVPFRNIYSLYWDQKGGRVFAGMVVRASGKLMIAARHSFPSWKDCPPRCPFAISTHFTGIRKEDVYLQGLKRASLFVKQMRVAKLGKDVL